VSILEASHFHNYECEGVKLQARFLPEPVCLKERLILAWWMFRGNARGIVQEGWP